MLITHFIIASAFPTRSTRCSTSTSATSVQSWAITSRSMFAIRGPLIREMMFCTLTLLQLKQCSQGNQNYLFGHWWNYGHSITSRRPLRDCIPQESLLLFPAHIHGGCHQYMQVGEEFPRPSNSIVRQLRTEARGIQQHGIGYKVANIARTS